MVAFVLFRVECIEAQGVCDNFRVLTGSRWFPPFTLAESPVRAIGMIRAQVPAEATTNMSVDTRVHWFMDPAPVAVRVTLVCHPGGLSLAGVVTDPVGMRDY